MVVRTQDFEFVAASFSWASLTLPLHLNLTLPLHLNL